MEWWFAYSISGGIGYDMKILKFNYRYEYFPKDIWDFSDIDNPVLVTPASFKCDYVGELKSGGNIYIYAVVPSEKDSIVEAWWAGLTPEQQAGCAFKTRGEFDTESDGWTQICLPPSTTKSQWTQMQEFVDAVV